MITEHGAKRAMRVLREAGFIIDEAKLPAMAKRWVGSVNDHGRIDDDELVAGAKRYITQDHPLHHWPSVGQLETCAIENRNRTGSSSYREPADWDQARASAEEARLAWKAAGYDPDAVRAELGMRRGPRLPKTWAQEAAKALDGLMPTNDTRSAA